MTVDDIKILIAAGLVHEAEVKVTCTKKLSNIYAIGFIIDYGEEV